MKARTFATSGKNQEPRMCMSLSFMIYLLYLSMDRPTYRTDIIDCHVSPGISKHTPAAKALDASGRRRSGAASTLTFGTRNVARSCGSATGSWRLST